MKKITLTLFTLFIFGQSFGQNLVSVNFRRSWDGIDFKQNHFGLNAHWLQDKSEVITGVRV